MNNASVYDDLYQKMQEVDKEKAIRMFGTIGGYIDFYETWIRLCSALSPSTDNPNRKLLERWRE